MSSVAFLVPGRLDTRTGGYAYDRRIIAGLRSRGWSVAVHTLDASFPFPTSAALDGAAAAMAAIPDDEVVVVDGLAYGALPNQVAREAARIRLVALVHHPLACETGLPPAAVASLRESETRALGLARLAIVTSRATAATLETYHMGLDRIVVVEPGTDPAPLASGSREGTHLLSVAALVPRKGYDTLFEALALLPSRNWRLTCVGSLERDREAVARLRALLKTRALENCVSLAGEADGPVLDKFYDDADVFVLPTWYEGYGMAVAEALARGIPVVSTPTGAIAELVGDHAGLLVPAGDISALAAALDAVIGDLTLRASLAAGAREARQRLVTWDVASAEMAKALEQAMSDERVQR